MKLIIGLGNPGVDYINTRHNIGFIVADALLAQKTPSGVVVKKSDKFMNESGKSVAALIHRYGMKPEDLYIIHDDLDIKLGEFKIQFGRGPKDHNGLKSVDAELGTNEYWHVRVGVDNRPLDNRPMGEEYVLQNFSDDEMIILNNLIKEICHKIINNDN